MPSRALVRGFLGLYATLGLVVLTQSVLTIGGALRGSIAPHDRIHALLLGGLEALAAVLFLVPRLMRWGAAILLPVFVSAFLLHSLEGRPPLTLLVYAAAVLFVRIHGVRGYHWSGGHPA